jgi:hypothetical protein
MVAQGTGIADVWYNGVVHVITQVGDRICQCLPAALEYCMMPSTTEID